MKKEQDTLQLLESIMDLGKMAYWEYDNISQEFTISSKYSKMFFRNKDLRFTLKSFVAMILPRYRTEVVQAFEEHLESGKEYYMEYEIQFHNKNVMYIGTPTRFSLDKKGTVTKAYGLIQDLTQQKTKKVEVNNISLEKVLVKTAQRLIQPDNLNNAIAYFLEASGRITNSKQCYFYLKTDINLFEREQEWIGEKKKPTKKALEILSSQNFPWITKTLIKDNYIDLNTVDADCECSAEEREFLFKITPPPFILFAIHKEDELLGFIGFDKTNQSQFSKTTRELIQVATTMIGETLQVIQTEKTVRYLSIHDNLTGLYNRSFFEAELERLDSARMLPVSLIIIDINGLKLANDGFGHKVGDQLLMQTAELLRQCCRQEDIICRIGGDEFIVILPETSSKQAETIRRRMIDKTKIKNNELPINLSMAVGISTKKVESDNILDAFKLAEEKMYRHKLLEGKKARLSIMDSLMDTLTQNNPNSGAHVAEVSRLSRIYSKSADLDIQTETRLDLLARYHDIGTAIIPKKIVSKESELSPDEQKIMDSHPETGYRIVKANPELSFLADMILHQKENWDGTGTPAGLKGKTIPLESRILAVINAWEHKRTRTSQKEADKYLKKESGHRFEPSIVKEFLKVMAN